MRQSIPLGKRSENVYYTKPDGSQNKKAPAASGDLRRDRGRLRGHEPRPDPGARSDLAPAGGPAGGRGRRDVLAGRVLRDGRDGPGPVPARSGRHPARGRWISRCRCWPVPGRKSWPRRRRSSWATPRASPSPTPAFDLITISFATRNINRSGAILAATLPRVPAGAEAGGTVHEPRDEPAPESDPAGLFHLYAALVVRRIGGRISRVAGGIRLPRRLDAEFSSGRGIGRDPEGLRFRLGVDEAALLRRGGHPSRRARPRPRSRNRYSGRPGPKS